MLLEKSLKTFAAAKGNKKYTNAAAAEFGAEFITLKAGKTFDSGFGVKADDEEKKLIDGKKIRKVRYFSGDEDIAEIDENGIITAKKAGECMVYAIAADGQWDVAAVTVQKKSKK